MCFLLSIIIVLSLNWQSANPTNHSSYRASVNFQLIKWVLSVQSCLAVQGGLQGSRGGAMDDGVWFIREHVWMFRLNHAACRSLVKANPEEIKDVDEKGVRGGRGGYSRGGKAFRRKQVQERVCSDKMPWFLYTDMLWLSFIFWFI